MILKRVNERQKLVLDYPSIALFAVGLFCFFLVLPAIVSKDLSVLVLIPSIYAMKTGFTHATKLEAIRDFS